MKSKPKGRQKRKESLDDEPAVQRVSGEALRGVFAILFVALSGFLVLARLGIGGTVGAVLYNSLSWLLGVGYLLLPLSFMLLAILIFRSFERNFGWVQFVSIAIFLLSSLGLIDIAFPTYAGVLGAAVATPALAAVDTIASVLFLLAFIIISLIIAFDVHLGVVYSSIVGWFRRNPDEALDESTDIDDVPVVGLPEEESEEESEEETEEEEPEPTVTTYQQKSESGGFPIFAASASTSTPPPVSLLAKNKGKPRSEERRVGK